MARMSQANSFTANAVNELLPRLGDKMSPIENTSFIAQQISFLRAEIEETLSLIENLSRNDGNIGWKSESCQKSTLQLLEERLEDERKLLADLESLERANRKKQVPGDRC